MGMISEFKEFALKGNMVDMAVGIVMGGAVGVLVTSLVENLINPIVGKFTGGVDFSKFGIKIGENEAGEALNLGVGAFIGAFINFLILAFVIFMIIKIVNNAKKSMGIADEAPAGPSDNDLLSEIRDALVKK